MSALARVELPAGSIEYGDTGGPGPVLVLIGGLAMIVWSRDGRMMPPEHGARFAAAFPSARLVELDGCDTLMPIDQPAALAKELCAFIGTPPSSIHRSVDGSVTGLNEE